MENPTYAAASPVGAAEFLLHLFISSASPNSLQALQNIQEICAQYLPGRHQLVVVDIQEHPEVAQQEQLLGIPTLIKKSPGLVRRLVGTLDDRDRTLRALGITS
jgi:circadian clock protein KaiB